MNSKRVSVCMATYNGEKYLKEQIESIIKQLGEKDEIVITDDCSSDSTVETIMKMSDSRIKVFRNSVNRGVKASFERSINESTGKYIFLSDQDDIWLENKIERTVTEFERSGAVLIVSDAYIMHGDFEIELETFYEIRKSGRGFVRNYIKNSFIGCCMAFRSNLKGIFLPFPDRIPMHDQWIGLLAEANGDTLFLPDRLQVYRRHESNVTSLKSASFTSAMQKRINLALSFLEHSTKTKYESQ